MNSTVVDFYKFARTNPEIIAKLSEKCDQEVFLARTVEAGQAAGFSFSLEEARHGLADISQLVEDIANDDELTDFELELVSAGFPARPEIKQPSKGTGFGK